MLIFGEMRLVIELLKKLLTKKKKKKQTISCPFQTFDCQMYTSHLFPCLPCLLTPFTVPCRMVFGHTWWTRDMSIPIQFASLYDGEQVYVWSDCLLDLGTDFLVGTVLCGLCMRRVVSCGSTSLPLLLFFISALLWGSWFTSIHEDGRDQGAH